MLGTSSDRRECRQSEQGVLDANANKPPGLYLRAIDHLTQEAIVVVVDRHKRSVSQGLIQPDLSPSFADISNLTVKVFAMCTNYTDRGAYRHLVSRTLSLICFLLERGRRIRDDTL
jgi:hypothetical protein